MTGDLKRHGDVPSNMPLMGKRMIARGVRSGTLFGTRQAVLEEQRQPTIDYWIRTECSYLMEHVRIEEKGCHVSHIRVP